MILIFQMLSVVMAAALLWGLVATLVHIAVHLPRLVRKLRFGIFDLLFFVTVIAVSLAVIRATWDTPLFGYALLIPFVAPLAWVVRFTWQDWRDNEVRRMGLRDSTLQIAEPAENGAADEPAPARHRHAKWWHKRDGRSYLPHLSPYSLSERPLEKE